MKEIKFGITMNHFERFQDLSEELKNLCQSAIDFASNAYAPYSKFRVSACAILDNNEIIKGTNVENASYPVGICAERNVLTHIISNYPKNKITALAIYVDKDLNEFVSPCGLCRQSLLEAETRQNHPIKIYLLGYKGDVLEVKRASDLLPLSFDGSSLDK